MISLEENVKQTIQSLLGRCDAPFKVMPLDQDLYQQCLEEAVRRGYPMDGHRSVKTYLREAVTYASNCLAHFDHRPTQIWVALWTSCAFFIDDTTIRPSERAHAYEFNHLFNQGKPQADGVLNALADLLHELPQHFQNIPSNLITTSILNFVTGTLLELETEGMKLSTDAKHYPTYCRVMSGLSEAYAFCVFPREVPINDYIQAMPEIMSFIDGINDVLSFYKEEKAGETTNRVSLLAARNNTSKLEALDAVAEITAQSCLRACKILEESPAAYGAFKHYAVGLVTVFASLDSRYQLVSLQL